MRSGQRLPQLTVQALQTTFSLAGAGVSAACDSRVKGNVSALLASAGAAYCRGFHQTTAAYLSSQ
ncbi:hypothetical protein MJ585_10075 [Klebsiella pneumoniae]|nr:hypothetical protein MJ585_10075 [Klebsiella pneumoniae]